MTNRRLLLIEDEPDLVLTIRDKLRSQGAIVDVAADGNAGWERALQRVHDLILLDLRLPGKGGLELVRELRAADILTPVLILSAMSAVTDRVIGLKLGADDYLPKPFDMGELVARVEALLRRVPAGGMVSQVKLPDFTIDFQRREVRAPAGLLTLPFREFELLRYLVERAGRVIPRDELLRVVWGMESDVFSRTVDVHVATLRRKIEPVPRRPRYIITVPGVGYRFTEQGLYNV